METETPIAETTPPAKSFEFAMPRPDNLQQMRLFYHPPGTLRATVTDLYSYPVVKMYQAVPLSAPNEYISLMNSKGEEIIMARRVEDFAAESRAVAEEEIRRRYLTARVRSVNSVKTEFGITYWNVVTDKGTRDFVIQSMSESCLWLSDTHVLLVDTDGNRFEILDRDALDESSRAQLNTVM